MPTLYGSFCRVDLADGVLVAMADSTTVRVVPAPPAPDASTRADLAADVARLERAVADLTRELSVVRGERDGLRVELDHQAAHRAAREGVDLGAWVRRADVVAALLADALDAELVSRLHTVPAARDALRSCARTTRDLAARFRGDLRSEHIESGEGQGVEGGGHETSVDPAAHCRKSRAEVTS